MGSARVVWPIIVAPFTASMLASLGRLSRGAAASTLLQRSFATGRKNVALILSGSGVYDGSEIHESVAVLTALSRRNAKMSFYAPDKPQAHVINHLTGEEMEEERNVRVESARIARGDVKDLATLSVEHYDALILPGGFGAAKNLCSFAFEGANCAVDEDVSTKIKEFHSAKKPIGLCCIAPVIAAKVLPGVSVTIGSDEGVSEAIEAFGSVSVKKNVNDVHVDEENKVITTPAYMCEAAVHEVADGIDWMVEEVLNRS